jgi:hypothetical protein
MDLDRGPEALFIGGLPVRAARRFAGARRGQVAGPSSTRTALERVTGIEPA